MGSQPPYPPLKGLLRQFAALPGGKKVLTSGLSLAGLLFGAVLVNAYTGVRCYRDLQKKFERLEDRMERFEDRMERFDDRMERYHRENQQDRKESEARLERMIHMMFSKQASEEQKRGKN